MRAPFPRPRLVAATLVALAVTLGGAVARAADTKEGGEAAKAVSPLDADFKASFSKARSDVGGPLQEALGLINSKKFPEATAKIEKAEAVAGRTPDEALVITMERFWLANAMADDATVVKTEVALMETGKLGLPARRIIERRLVVAYFKQKEFTEAVKWSRQLAQDTDNGPESQELLIKSLFNAGDYPGAITVISAMVDADTKAGHVTSEDYLKLLYQSQVSANEAPEKLYSTILLLLTHYPSTLYWDAAMRAIYQMQGLPDRADLDMYRLRMAVGGKMKRRDYREMAALASRAGFPAEAKRALDRGFAVGELGAADGGADAETDRKDLAKITKDVNDDLKSLGQAAKDAERAKTGDALLNNGYNLVLNGKAEQGIALMDAGFQKGSLKYTDDAHLHFGIALLEAGQKDRALEQFQAVQGNDALKEIAHLWALSATLPPVAAK